MYIPFWRSSVFRRTVLNRIWGTGSHQRFPQQTLVKALQEMTLLIGRFAGGLQSQSQPVGGCSSEKTSAGVLKPRHARGRLLSSFSTCRTSEWEMSRKLVPLGKY